MVDGGGGWGVGGEFYLRHYVLMQAEPWYGFEVKLYVIWKKVS